MPHCKRFDPAPAADITPVAMGVDEYEAIRLIDYEGLDQSACAARMEVARTTVTRIYESARRKLAQALVEGRPLVIDGGDVQICTTPRPECAGQRSCCHRRNIALPSENTGDSLFIQQGETDMKKIAVTYENGEVFQHFGHTPAFKIYAVEDGTVTASTVLPTGESGHGALAAILAGIGVDVLLCGGIGGGARTALTQHGILLFSGVQGNADEAVAALLNGTLLYDPDYVCNHHDHGEGHTCGEHGCGSHDCGEHEEGHSCGHCHH